MKVAFFLTLLFSLSAFSQSDKPVKSKDPFKIDSWAKRRDARLRGEREGGGGSSVIADFILHARASLAILSNYNRGLISPFDFTSVLSEVRVVPYSITGAGNVLTKTRVASYDADKDIIHINPVKWPKNSCRQKLMIASHEYLRALGLEGSNYKYSLMFLKGGLSYDMREFPRNFQRRIKKKCREIRNQND